MLPGRPENTIATPICVGGVELRNRAFLAPMSGITDAVFRKLAWKHGAGLVVSEMVASKALLEGDLEMQLKAQKAGIPIHMIQLAGREAEWMGLAAKMAEANGADIIDINMGCPAKRVTTGYSGSALMRDLDHALRLIEAVVKSVKIPVTLKMRLGWDDQSINAPELAYRAEAAGIQMITVHGRTRCQFYKGKANWAQVANVKALTSLPVVVNGDVTDHSAASEALSLSGADAVMVGRGAYGAPWLPGQLAGKNGAESPSLSDTLSTVLEHYEGMLNLYGREGAIRPARKHLSWYLDSVTQLEGLSDLKRKILTSWNPDDVIADLSTYFAILEGEESVCIPPSVAA